MVTFAKLAAGSLFILMLVWVFLRWADVLAARRVLRRELESDGLTVLKIMWLPRKRLRFLAVDHDRSQDVTGSCAVSDPASYVWDGT